MATVRPESGEASFFLYNIYSKMFMENNKELWDEQDLTHGTNIQTLEYTNSRIVWKTWRCFACQLIAIERLSTIWGGYFHLGGSHFLRLHCKQHNYMTTLKVWPHIIFKWILSNCWHNHLQYTLGLQWYIIFIASSWWIWTQDHLNSISIGHGSQSHGYNMLVRF